MHKLKSGLLVALLAITLTYQDNSDNEVGFNLYRMRGTVWSLIATTVADIVEVTDLSSAPGDCYQVSAFNDAGESTFSNSVCLPLLPQAPTNLQKKK